MCVVLPKFFRSTTSVFRNLFICLPAYFDTQGFKHPMLDNNMDKKETCYNSTCYLFFLLESITFVVYVFFWKFDFIYSICLMFGNETLLNLDKQSAKNSRTEQLQCFTKCHIKVLGAEKAETMILNPAVHCVLQRVKTQL